MNITIKDIDDLKEHLAEAIGDRVQKQIDPLIQKVQGVEGRVGRVEQAADSHGDAIKNLKANQAKALVGWTVLVAGLTTLIGTAKTWVWSHFHFS